MNILKYLLIFILSFGSFYVEATQSGTSAVRDDSGETSTNINQAADTGKKSQDAGKMLNMLASAALMAACAASCPKCKMELCAMGALAAMQAANQGDAANQSELTYEASEYNGTDTGLNTNSDVKTAAVDGTGEASFKSAAVKEGMQKLKDEGYMVTADGVTYPDGSFKPSSAFSSPAAMTAAGIDDGTVSAAQDVLKGINKDLQGASVSSMAVDSGAGGYSGGGGGSSGFGDFSSYKAPQFKNPFANKNNKALLAGKSVLVGGEPIGVKGDNLFDMIHRAYQGKRAKKQFNENYGSPVRLPSSASSSGGSL